MKISVAPLAALALLAGFAAAHAEDERASAPLTAYLQSIGQGGSAAVEGRQAAPIATVAAPNAVDRYLIDRNAGEQH